MYKLVSFDGVDVPAFNVDNDTGATPIDSRILDSIGGAYDYHGTSASYARRHDFGTRGIICGDIDFVVDHSGNYVVDHNGNRIIAGSGANRARTQYEALAAKVGVSGLLVRERFDDAVRHERRCALVSIAPVEFISLRLWRVQCKFESATPYWRGQTAITGQVSFSANAAAAFSVNNGGNAVAFDGLLTVTATSTITSIVIANSASSANLVWSGTLNSSEALVLDCGAETIKIDGADAYSGFTLGASHSARRWCPLALGVNTLSITANGTGSLAVSFREKWQ